MIKSPIHAPQFHWLVEGDLGQHRGSRGAAGVTQATQPHGSRDRRWRHRVSLRGRGANWSEGTPHCGVVGSWGPGPSRPQPGERALRRIRRRARGPGSLSPCAPTLVGPALPGQHRDPRSPGTHRLLGCIAGLGPVACEDAAPGRQTLRAAAPPHTQSHNPMGAGPWVSTKTAPSSGSCHRPWMDGWTD